MESVIRFLPFLVFFIGSLSFGSGLDQAWEKAIQSPAQTQPEQWQSWIQRASEEKIESAEAYFNLAHTFWEKDEVAQSVKNLLLSAQKRNSIFKSWTDLKLLRQIQKSLLNQETPESFWKIQFLVLNESHLKPLWLFCLTWFALSTLFLRLGFQKPKPFFKVLGAAWLLTLATGLGGYLALSQIPQPFILDNGPEAIPVYSSENDLEEKITDLPSGIVVFSHQTNKDWICLKEPIRGCVPEKFSQPLPQLFKKKAVGMDSSRTASGRGKA